MTRVPESDDEQAPEVIDGRTTGIQHDYLHFNPSLRSPTTSWDTALRRTCDLFKIYDQCTVKLLWNVIHSLSHATSSFAGISSIGCKGGFMAPLRSLAVSWFFQYLANHEFSSELLIPTFIRSTNWWITQYHTGGCEFYTSNTAWSHAAQERFYAGDWHGIRIVS